MCLASLFKSNVVLSSVFLLVACGGGGGDSKKSSSSSVVSASSVSSISSVSSSSSLGLLSQTLSFELDEDVVVKHGSFTNQAIGEGIGTITYSSNNPDVASVDNLGQVSVHAPGVAIIIANKAADSRYLAATAQYTVRVLSDSISVNAWVGSNDTLVEFPDLVSGFEFYRSTEIDCNIESILTCANGQLNTLGDMAITDTAVNSQRQGYYVLKHGQFSGNLQIDPRPQSSLGKPDFHPQSIHDVVVHNGKLWLFGTGENGLSLLNPSHGIWTSTDGLNWIQQSISPGDETMLRLSFNVLSFDNRLWMIGGDYFEEQGSKAVFEASIDNELFNWTDITSNNVFSSRITQPVVFNNKLWIIGGTEGSAVYKNDVWSSADGVEWTQESTSAGFSARNDHQVVSFKDKLWLIGGSGANIRGEKDVWSSVDGVNWVKETDNAAFGYRHNHQVVSFKDKLWLIGGLVSTENEEDSFTFTRANDIWSSTDGVHWTQETESAPFSPRTNHQAVVFDNKLFVIGGMDDNQLSKNDIWSSIDGINWRKGYVATMNITEQLGN